MSVYHYEPFFSFDDILRFFDDALNSRSSNNQQQLTRSGGDSGEQRTMLARGFTPKMDIHEDPEQNRLTATFELPGMSKENVNIDVQSGRLVVSGEQMVSKDVEEKGYMHRERQMGRFSRTLPLPAGTKPSDVQAKMENGLLKVMFPKNSQEQQPQRVAIQ